jgi:pilus assembly protein CpaB
MSILVSEEKGVAGFVKPGDRVDIIGSFEVEIPEATQKALNEKGGGLVQDKFHTSQTVLQNVIVLAIAQEMYDKDNLLDDSLKGTAQTNSTPASTGNNGKDPVKGKLVSSVTLAVTPEQAEKLTLADSRGSLRLSLRPDGESEEVELLGAMSDDIVPFQNVFQKVAQMASGMGNMFHEPELPSESAAPPPPVLPSHSVQVYEGTNATNVSFD